MQWTDALATARLIAVAGPMWPAAQPPKGRRLRIRRAQRDGCANLPTAVLRAREARRRSATHCWMEVHGVSRCEVCWAVRSKHGIAARADCPLRSTLHVGVAVSAQRQGHDMWLAEVIRSGRASTALLVCMQCGAFVESGDNPALRSARCRQPTRHGAAQLSRVRRGLHPRTGAVGLGASLQGLQRLPPQEADTLRGVS